MSNFIKETYGVSIDPKQISVSKAAEKKKVPEKNGPAKGTPGRKKGATASASAAPTSSFSVNNGFTVADLEALDALGAQLGGYQQFSHLVRWMVSKGQ